MQQNTELPFAPGVYSKCAATIDSCETLEQLTIANRFVCNNKESLTPEQYKGLKRKIFRHPNYNELVLNYIDEQEKVIAIPRRTFALLIFLGLICWVVFFWGLL